VNILQQQLNDVIVTVRKCERRRKTHTADHWAKKS